MFLPLIHECLGGKKASTISPAFKNSIDRYPTARELWKGIEARYSSGRDRRKIYDPTLKASTIRQGGDSIEVFYGTIVSVWKEIDRRDPNPMRCAEDITIYSNLVQKNRLYQFLAGINDGLYKERRDLLNQDPLPTVEQAYTQIRREVIKRGIMGADSPLGNSPSEIGSSLATKGRPENPRARKDSKTNFICTHCGGTRHTKEGCFKIIGYPEWWPELKKRAKETPLTEKGKGGHKDGKANFSGSVAVPEGKDETGGMANIQGEGFSDGEDYWAWY